MYRETPAPDGADSDQTVSASSDELCACTTLRVVCNEHRDEYERDWAPLRWDAAGFCAMRRIVPQPIPEYEAGRGNFHSDMYLQASNAIRFKTTNSDPVLLTAEQATEWRQTLVPHYTRLDDTGSPPWYNRLQAQVASCLWWNISIQNANTYCNLIMVNHRVNIIVIDMLVWKWRYRHLNRTRYSLQSFAMQCNELIQSRIELIDDRYKNGYWVPLYSFVTVEETSRYLDLGLSSRDVGSWVARRARGVNDTKWESRTPELMQRWMGDSGLTMQNSIRWANFLQGAGLEPTPESYHDVIELVGSEEMALVILDLIAPKTSDTAAPSGNANHMEALSVWAAYRREHGFGDMDKLRKLISLLDNSRGLNSDLNLPMAHLNPLQRAQLIRDVYQMMREWELEVADLKQWLLFGVRKAYSKKTIGRYGSRVEMDWTGGSYHSQLALHRIERLVPFIKEQVKPDIDSGMTIELATSWYDVV